MAARELVTRALELLRANYIFPNKADEAAAGIEARLTDGAYDELDEEALGERLTAELFAVCADKHLRVRAREAAFLAATNEDELRAAWFEESRRNAYGIAKVERLDGNVGCIDLREIAHPGVGGRAIAAAMELVSHTEALVFDLRRCVGGSPHGVIFWHSYLFADADTFLNTIYDGATGSTRQFWSASWLPGERYVGRPVYVLTSGFTFSGGEEFAYNLKALGRATVVGETTGGGAHPTDQFAITPTLEITVPVARSINPVTGTNWEGTGVEPDVAVAADEALNAAYQRALEHVAATTTSTAVRDEARAALAPPNDLNRRTL